MTIVVYLNGAELSADDFEKIASTEELNAVYWLFIDCNMQGRNLKKICAIIINHHIDSGIYNLSAELADGGLPVRIQTHRDKLYAWKLEKVTK